MTALFCSVSSVQIKFLYSSIVVLFSICSFFLTSAPWHLVKKSLHLASCLPVDYLRKRIDSAFIIMWNALNFFLHWRSTTIEICSTLKIKVKKKALHWRRKGFVLSFYKRMNYVYPIRIRSLQCPIGYFNIALTLQHYFCLSSPTDCFLHTTLKTMQHFVRVLKLKGNGPGMMDEGVKYICHSIGKGINQVSKLLKTAGKPWEGNKPICWKHPGHFLIVV